MGACLLLSRLSQGCGAADLLYARRSRPRIQDAIMSEVYVNEPSTNGKVVLRTTLGDLDIELWSRECPMACRNFLQLCCEGYYTGLIFHRVIKDFIVQTGDPTGTGRGGSDTAVNDGKLFDLEIHPRLKFRYRGLVGVANLLGGVPAGTAGRKGCGTNGNQFFITLSRCDALNNTHTLFGKITGHSLYNLMKFSDLEIDKNDRPVCPPVIKGVDVLWMPFSDIQPRPERQKQLQNQSYQGSGRGRGRGARGGDDESPGRNEQQKGKLQKPDKKLLSFGEEQDEDEEEGEGGGGAAAGNGSEKQDRGEKDMSNSSSVIARSGGAGGASTGKSASSKKILSAHDVLEDDPLLQKSSATGTDTATASSDSWETEASGAIGAKGKGAESEASSSSEEDEKGRPLRRKQKKRRRGRGSSNSRRSSEDSSSAYSSDDSIARAAPIKRRSNAEAGDRTRRYGKGDKEGGPSSSSTVALVRSKLAALASAEDTKSGGKTKRPGHGGNTGASGEGGEKESRSSLVGDKDHSARRAYSSTTGNSQPQHHRDNKDDRRGVEALRLWTGGGSFSRGAHADKERLQDSDLMTEKEKTRQLYVLRKRDTGRQQHQTDTLEKLDAFTRQLRLLRERQSSSTADSSSNSAAAEKSSSSSSQKGEGKSRKSSPQSGNAVNRTKAGNESREKDTERTAEAGTLNAWLPDLDEEIDENDGSWLSGGGLHFAVDSNRAYQLDDARAAANVVVYDPLRGAGDLAAKKMQQRRQQQAVTWKEGRRDIGKW